MRTLHLFFYSLRESHIPCHSEISSFALPGERRNTSVFASLLSPIPCYITASIFHQRGLFCTLYKAFLPLTLKISKSLPLTATTSFAMGFHICQYCFVSILNYEILYLPCSTSLLPNLRNRHLGMAVTRLLYIRRPPPSNLFMLDSLTPPTLSLYNNLVSCPNS